MKLMYRKTTTREMERISSTGMKKSNIKVVVAMATTIPP